MAGRSVFKRTNLQGPCCQRGSWLRVDAMFASDREGFFGPVAHH
jgi:hypothetical protein